MKGKHHETHLVDGKTTWNPFFQVDPWKTTSLKKKQESQI